MRMIGSSPEFSTSRSRRPVRRAVSRSCSCTARPTRERTATSPRYGGRAAWIVAALHPERVRDLVTFNG